MRRLFIFVGIIFIVLFFGRGNVLFAQVSSSSKPAVVPSAKTSSNPYSAIMSKINTPNTPPPKNTSPQNAPQKQNAPDLGNVEPVSPYGSDRDIFLIPDSPKSRATRNPAKTNSPEDDALSKVRGIIREYDPEVLSYEADLAKLNAIEAATAVGGAKKNAADPRGNSVAKNTTENDPLATSAETDNFANTPALNDPSVVRWENELAKLQRSVDAESKAAEISALALRIDRRKQFLTRQAESLRGADIFIIDPSVQLAQRYLEDGWCNLFDGKTLFGWRVQEGGHYGGGHFEVKNGEICSDPRHPGLLYTTNQFGDSTIMLDFCVDDSAELFLLYRTSPNPRDLHSSCYTVVLNSSDPQRPRGTILGRVKLDREQIRSIDRERQNELSELSELNETGGKRKEIWHKMRLSCDGGTLSCTIDQQRPTTLTDVMPIGRGYIGLLVTRGAARFRNMTWRPGAAYPLFDGIDIDASWRYRRGTIAANAVNASMQLRNGNSNGNGVIESLESFTDFVLQFEYRVTSTSGKAGLFFRANPREERSGYEVSLQNFPSRKDRDEFFAIDAGSFVGRQNGRYVGAGDLQWNYFTLSAVDRQFQTWINGVPACEMTDKSPNPKTITVVKSKDSIDGKEILDYMLPTKNEFHKEGTLQFNLATNNSDLDIRNIKIIKITDRTAKIKTFEDHKKTTWKAKIKEEARIQKEMKLDTELRENKQKP